MRMRIKRALLISAFGLFISGKLLAQDNVCLYRIEQTFKGWVDCSSHTPKWSSTSVTINGEGNSLDSGNGCIDITSMAYIGEDGSYYGKFDFDLRVKEMEHKKTWIMNGKIVKPGNNEFYHEESEVCGGLGSKKEGWKATLSVIFDDPIDVTNKSASHLVIEKDKLNLRFSMFYDNGGKKVLQYRCTNASDKTWKNVVNQPSILSGKQVSLSYEDIVGAKTSVRYKECSGKELDFRVVKTLSDGVTLSSGKTSTILFYHQGPDFSYKKIRQVKCLGGPGLSISVHLTDPKNIDVYLNNPSVFHWVLGHYAKAVKYDDKSNKMIDGDGNVCTPTVFYLNKAKCSDEGDMILVGDEKDGKFSLDKYLNEKSDEDPLAGLWELQLQYVDRSPEELNFVSHWFKLDDPVAAIKPNHEAGNYVTSDGYSIVSTHTPEIKVKIPDKDYKNRMDYKIYQFGEGTSSILGNDESAKVANFYKVKGATLPIATITESQYQSDGIYSITNLKVDKTAKPRYFYIQDNDGCIYEVPYKAVQKDFSTTPESGYVVTDPIKQSGSTPCDAEYSTTIKYDGGAFPYTYDDKDGKKTVAPNTEIKITGLKYTAINGSIISGKNIVTFTDKTGNNKEDVEINLPFTKPLFDACDQTCSEANGIIKVSTSKGTFLPSYYVLEEDTSKTGIFTGLKTGKYTVLCHYSDECYVSSDEVDVGSNVFTVTKTPDPIPELEDFDKSAKVTITPQYSNVLDWTNSNTYNLTSPGEKILKSGRYDYSVTNTDAENRTCTVTDGFEIKAPHVELNLKIETYSENTGYIKTGIIKNDVSNSDEIKNSIVYYGILNNNKKTIGSEFAYSNNKMSFEAEYKLKNESKKYEIASGEGVVPIFLTGEVDDYFKSSPQPNCYKESVTWALKEGYEACFKDGDIWGGTITLSQGENEITIRKKETLKRFGASNDFITSIENIGYKDFIIKINTISFVDFTISEKAVSCLGDSNGSVEITSVTPIKADDSYSYDIEIGELRSNTKKLENIHAGTGKIIVTDNYCHYSEEKSFTIARPNSELKVNTVVTQPSCHDDGGIIKVEASGGWPNYSVSIDEEVDYCDVKENDPKLFDRLSTRNHTIFVKDRNGCLQKFDTEIHEYTNPSVKDALTDQTSCYGYSDGRIKEIMVETNGKLNGKDVTPSKLFYSFTPKNNDLYEKIKEKELPWTDGIDNLAAGDYELWVEDNNGCMTNNKDGSIVMSFTVGQPEHVQLEVKKIADVSGYGASDAVIKVRADGGNNCDKKIYVKKEEAEDESAATEVREDAQSEDEYFIGEAATRGVEYQIAKYPFAEGTYSFYVRDKEKDCPSNVVNDIVVESPDEPLSADIVVRKALCHNQTGSIDITPRGGWGPPYEVIVDGVRYSATPRNPKITVGKLISGEYTVTVKDARKRVVYTTTADVPMPNDDMSFGEGTVFVADRCSGNGGAHIEIVGGSGEYNIMMDGENYTTDKFDIDGLRAGHYKIDVVDGNKCEAVLEFEIADERLSADILSYNKADDGATLEAVVAGGVEPYSYEWRHVDGLLNQRANVSVIDNLEHGIYTLLVTDAGECHAGPIAKEVVTDGDQRLEVVQLQRETGVGSADGYVVLKSGVTDFVSQKIYHIESDGSSTVSDIKVEWVDGLLKVDNLSSGDYVVKCQHSDNMHFSMARFRIEPYEKLDIEGVEVRHVTMPRNRDGRIRISLKVGIAPFAATVAHNTNAAFEPLTIESGDRCFDMERLMAGEYTLTVTDSTRREANMAVQTFVVEEPEYLSLSADMTPAMCYGEPSGKVKLTATGGWGKYMYEYASNGYEKTTEYRRLFPGMQMFSVIDEYGTRKTIEVMVEQPDEVRTQIAQIDSVDCYGSNTGSVTFQVKGGDSNYTMWYSDKNQDELLYSKAEVTHSGLSMGNYRVTFRDGNDCMSVDTITVFIPEPDLLELANDDVVNTTCELDNGKIAIEMKGGSLPYTYSWRENGEEYGGAKTLAMTRSEASGLKQNGLYSIEIVDKNGCKASYEKRIEPSENPRVLGVSTTDVLCYGSSDGVAAVDSAQVKWAYPKADYHLTWPQGQDGVMSVNTLPTGTYIVKITDDNNCSSTTEFTVGTPQPVKNHLVGLRNAMCYGYSDGRIETRTIGGVGDYRYIWSTGEETSYASNLRAGTYKVIVADSHECVDSATFETTEPEELKVNLGEDVIVCPGSSYTFDAGEFASYQWYREDADEVIETERKLTTTDGGNIHILVKNEIGCMARDTVFLGISNEALVANFFVASNVSLNDTVVAIELSNMQPDRIVWEYVNDAFNDVSPSDSTNTYRYLRTEKLGTQYITMWAYKGDCVSSDTKQVDVFENVEVFDDFEIGYDPLIKSVKVAPNPNNGEFFLIITLREVNDVVLRMTDVAGSKVMDRVLSGADYYYEKIDIGKSGIFILTLTVGDEIKSIKILSVK